MKICLPLMTLVLTFIVTELSFWAVTEAFLSLSCEYKYYIHNIDDVKQASERALSELSSKKIQVERGALKYYRILLIKK